MRLYDSIGKSHTFWKHGKFRYILQHVKSS